MNEMTEKIHKLLINVDTWTVHIQNLKSKFDEVL